MMQRLSSTKAKMEAALNKATPKPAVAPIPVKILFTAHVAAPALVAVPLPVAQPVISVVQEPVFPHVFQAEIPSVLKI
jgi:hypothetical protein